MDKCLVLGPKLGTTSGKGGMSEGSKGNGNESEPSESSAAAAGAHDAMPNVRAVILVDVSNVAYGKNARGGKPLVSYIKRVLEHLESYPVKVVAIADATLRHKVDTPEDVEALLSGGSVQQVPAGTSADDYLWELWKRYTKRGQRAYILTNDKFPNDRNAQESIVTWSPRITHFFVDDELVLNPSLELILEEMVPAAHAETPAEMARTSTSVSGGVTAPDASFDGAAATHARDTTRPPDASIEPTVATVPSRPLVAGRGSIAELTDVAIRLIAQNTDAPGGEVRRVNFAKIAHDLQFEAGRDFVERFGLGRPKDLATRMAENGLVAISYSDATMYVEPTAKLESIIEQRSLPRKGSGGSLGTLESKILLHLLEHRGRQIRFEASQWTTEFGILRKFSHEDPVSVQQALRELEVGRLIYRRTQYVVGYSEAKHVFSLTPSGHRAAIECQRGESVKLTGGSSSSLDTSPTRDSRPIDGPPPHDDGPEAGDDDDQEGSFSDETADDNPADDWQSDSGD